MASARLMFLLATLGVAAAAEHEVWGYINDSVILPCLTSHTDMSSLRFYWQKGENTVYWHKDGKQILHSINESYVNRTTAFPEEMKQGNISVRLHNLTLLDDKNLFKVLSSDENTKMEQVCLVTLHVAARYQNHEVTVMNTGTGTGTGTGTITAVCIADAGFPKPQVTWTFHKDQSKQQEVVNASDVCTTEIQDPQTNLYSMHSTTRVPKGKYDSVTCRILNPTTNLTLSPTTNLTLSSPKVFHQGFTENTCPSCWGIGLFAFFGAVVVCGVVVFVLFKVKLLQWCPGGEGGGAGAGGGAGGRGGGGAGAGAGGVAGGGAEDAHELEPLNSAASNSRESN
ncbi:ICOS ligand-like [Genypterus blacodes]|uniref:ICOS ligand-like n=1 Tax=Genypterus blacodes TaxID=154954 RepID=UPI003F765AE0